jgi:hypothetical protein
MNRKAQGQKEKEEARRGRKLLHNEGSLEGRCFVVMSKSGFEKLPRTTVKGITEMIVSGEATIRSPTLTALKGLNEAVLEEFVQ